MLADLNRRVKQFCSDYKKINEDNIDEINNDSDGRRQHRQTENKVKLIG